MTALRQDVLAMVENWPEESLQSLLDYMRQSLQQNRDGIHDGEENLWAYDSPHKEGVKFLWGLLEGTPPMDAKKLRKERLEKYENHM